MRRDRRRAGKIRCDYYDYLNADDSPAGQRARQAYRGEYMAQYTWAEVTNSHLSFYEAGANEEQPIC